MSEWNGDIPVTSTAKQRLMEVRPGTRSNLLRPSPTKRSKFMELTEVLHHNSARYHGFQQRCGCVSPPIHKGRRIKIGLE